MSYVAKIIIGDHEYARFKSYSVTHDLYAAAGSFDFELYPDTFIKVAPGARAQVYINEELEMTGIIDAVTRGYDQNGRHIRVAGRDLMGLVVDSYCTLWKTLQNKNTVEVAETLLKNVPYLNRKNIEAEAAAKKRDAAKPYLQPEPGSTIFDVLRDAAASRGLLFYSRPNGALCFRKPAGRGEVNMNITRRTDEQNRYIISAERTQDYKERFSEYIVITQGAGMDDEQASEINAVATAIDADVPYYKPYVAVMGNDGGSVSKRANMLLEERRTHSDSITYTLKGHSQNARNWTVDDLVRVDDDELDVHKVLLIYSRTFNLSRDGITVSLTLGEPGLLS